MTLQMKESTTWLTEFALAWMESTLIGKVQHKPTWFPIHSRLDRVTKDPMQNTLYTVVCKSVAQITRNQCLSFIPVPLVNIFQKVTGKDPGSWERQTL